MPLRPSKYTFVQISAQMEFDLYYHIIYIALISIRFANGSFKLKDIYTNMKTCKLKHLSAYLVS